MDVVGKRIRQLLAAGGLTIAAAWPAQAQFEAVPAPLLAEAPANSLAADDKAYRADGARHLYATYPKRIFRGKLPPLMYAIAITETEIDEEGRVVNAVVVREPAAAKHVGPWVLELIKAAGPFPKPERMGRVKYLDIWLVDKGGNFQLDTLTEGQLDALPTVRRTASR